MRYAEFLKKNGTIGFAAPSFGCAAQPYKGAFDNALKNFTQIGYKCMLGPNCYAAEGIGISSTPKKCGEELTQMYCSPDNDVLISCGGGELMCETLEYVDFDAVKNAEPKWYLGYSDNTNFTFLQTTLCDTASVYGMCAGAFGMEPWHKSVDDTFSVLTGRGAVYSKSDEGGCGSKCSSDSGDGGCVSFKFNGYDKWEKESLKSEECPTASMNVTEPRVIHVFNGDKRQPENTSLSFSGRLIGGCMDCLVNLLGTKYDRVSQFNERYKEDGFIWFLESCDLNVFAIRRAMWQMDNAGLFKYLKGFIIGRPLVFGQELMGLDQYDAVLGIIGKYNVPVVMDIDLGHLSPTMPIICGSLGEVSVEGNDYSVGMRLV